MNAANLPAKTAVLTAYGFSANKNLLAQLLALNQQVAAKIEKGEPGMPPGVPWEKLEKKMRVPKQAKNVRGKPNVPRERFRLRETGYKYTCSRKDFLGEPFCRLSARA